MNEQLLASIAKHVSALNEQDVLETIDKALAKGIAPADIVSQSLSAGLETVGNKFEKGEFFLPGLMLSGEIMKKAIEKIRPYMVSGERQYSGIVLLGTIEGDIHYIGKNIVSAVLEGDGYEVHDIGVDVAPSVFLDKAKEIQPDVIGMSALISMAVSKMTETISLLKDHGVQSKVIVGGAALTEKTAQKIGADDFAFDAWQGLRIVRRHTNR